MILHWDQLVLHYGAGIGVHRPRFEEAIDQAQGNGLTLLPGFPGHGTPP